MPRARQVLENVHLLQQEIDETHVSRGQVLCGRYDRW